MDNGISIVDYPTQVGMITRTIKVRAMKDKALELLEQIEANVSVCCAITMEPEEVLAMIEELREEISKL
jgi:3-deoxy-D-arabino-heptulosonate 7-phosphate (DAHP) synthase class II